jgi:hypothetical protein
MKIILLYEDKLSRDARSPSGYIPHQFLIHCVADRLQVDPWELLDRIRGMPLNGVGNLKGAMFEPGRFNSSGQNLVFVADADVVHEHFGVPYEPPASLCKTILAGLPDRTGIELFLLVDNLETVVSAAAQSLGRLTPVKEHTERDRVLGAMLDPSRSSQRSQVVAQVAMLDDIVTHLSTVISVQNAHS